MWRPGQLLLEDDSQIPDFLSHLKGTLMFISVYGNLCTKPIGHSMDLLGFFKCSIYPFTQTFGRQNVASRWGIDSFFSSLLKCHVISIDKMFYTHILSDADCVDNVKGRWDSLAQTALQVTDFLIKRIIIFFLENNQPLLSSCSLCSFVCVWRVRV